MNKVSKDLDVMIIGAAIVDLPLRPVSKGLYLYFPKQKKKV